MTNTKGRVAPREPEDWDDAVRAVLGATQQRVAQLEGVKGTVSPPNILLTIAHQSDLLGPFVGFASALALKGALSRRDSELLALRAAWNCGSPFEWGHHALYGRAAGLSDEEMARIAEGPEAEGWSTEERTLLRAADQLHAGQNIDDATWQQLASNYAEPQLVEIPFVVGQYTMLSMVANSTGVELEPGLPPMPHRSR